MQLVSQFGLYVHVVHLSLFTTLTQLGDGQSLYITSTNPLYDLVIQILEDKNRDFDETLKLECELCKTFFKHHPDLLSSAVGN